MAGQNWGDWQGHYYDTVLKGKGVSGIDATKDMKITQTRDQFLNKYKDAIDANGNFIPGKANLYFDGENAGSVYDSLIGYRSGDGQTGGYFAPEVDMGWIADDREAGWLRQNGINPDTLIAAGLLGAGGYALMGGFGGGAAGAAAAGEGAAAGGLGTGAAAGGGLLSTIGGYASAAGNFLKDNKWAAGLLGAGLGASASGDTTTSASKDPWGPAQGYLKDNLATNARMQQYYQANPFSQEQKAAYQGLLDTNANGLSNAGNYNQIANNFMGSNRGLMGQMPTLNTGVKAAPVDWSKYANIGKG